MNVPLFDGSNTTNGELVTKLLLCQRQHRIPTACLEKVMNLFRNALPNGHTLPNLTDSKRALVDEKIKKFLTVDVCINDCIIYSDLPFLFIQNSHLRSCPICRQPRYEDGKPQKVNIYFYIKSIYFYIKSLGIP
jgi:hypothetical protein